MRVSRLESQGRIEARTTLLDKCKVKPGRVCDCLHASLLGSGWRDWLWLVWRCIAVIQWNGWLVLNFEGPFEFDPEVRILCAAIPGVPAEVHILGFIRFVSLPDILGAGRPDCSARFGRRIQI